MADRFELEQNIISCWNITDDLRLLYENVMNTEMSRDEIANVLMGLIAVSDMRSAKCFSTFEDLIHERKM